MIPERRITIRPAAPADRNAITALMRYEPQVHSHLDWKPAEEWLGTQPYLVAERGKRVIGALACAPDPPNAAWLRLFVAVSDAVSTDIWDLLWPPIGVPASVQVREARRSDYDAIAATDLAAFRPPWQMSATLMSQAIPLADLITVAEIDQQIVGYQLTTPSYQGAHLARLAVLPSWQGNGIGKALVRHLIDYYNRRGIRELTVNTQDTNTASLSVYHDLGFENMGLSYPVFQLNLSGPTHE